MADDLLTLDEAAAEFGVHRTTLFRAVREGRLKRLKLVGDRRTFLSRSQVQKVIDPPMATHALQIVYDAFAATAEWPIANAVQRDFDREQDPFDFLSAIELLPPQLGWRTRDREGRVQLTIRGIARCEGSGVEVRAFLDLVRACYSRYLSNDEKPEVRGEEVGAAFGWPELLKQKVYKMVQIEAGFWAGLGHTGANWVLTIDLERIRHFRNIQTLADYFAAKDRAFQPAVQPESLMRFGVLGQTGPRLDQESVPGLKPRADQAVGKLVAAAAAFERSLVKRTGARGVYGRRLIDAFFDLAQQGAPPDPSRLEALRSIALGAMSAFRNPAAHGKREFTPSQATDAAAMFRLLTREVEAIPVPRKDNRRPALDRAVRASGAAE